MTPTDSKSIKAMAGAREVLASRPNPNLAWAKGTLTERAAAEKVGVSLSTLRMATRVLRRGTPEIIQAVDEGRISISTADRICSHESDQQIEMLSKDGKVERRKGHVLLYKIDFLDGSTYIGITAQTLWERLQEHAKGYGKVGAKIRTQSFCVMIIGKYSTWEGARAAEKDNIALGGVNLINKTI